MNVIIRKYNKNSIKLKINFYIDNWSANVPEYYIYISFIDLAKSEYTHAKKHGS